jgi:hypothetical protein
MADRLISTETATERRAAAVSKVLDTAAARIPGLKTPNKETARSMRGHRTVPRAFIRSMMAAVDAVEQLRGPGMLDVDEAEAALEFEAAFRPLVATIARLLNSLTYTIDLRLSPVTTKALRTYALAKALARSKKHAKLIGHLHALKRDLGRKGPRKKRKKNA